MDIRKLAPILNKESILKTANARELGDNPEDVLERYRTYALTHIALGDTTKQLKDLERVIIDNKLCAVGAIVGPYGYGKTSTAIHLWNELREQKILAIPPFLWVNLSELMEAVYHWLRFEFSLGPKTFIEPLEDLYDRYRQSYKDEIFQKIDPEYAQSLLDKGTLVLDIRPDDVVKFFAEASELCEKAGYKGLVIFTDELQQTLAQYKPSRDEFFAHIFQIVKDIQGMEGHWALVISMDNDTEGMISRLRSDILARMQRSALYFRVKEMYNRREYPSELWLAFQQRFEFNGDEVISPYTLDSIGQIAARDDLGAGPRMVTQAFALAIKSYEKTEQPYTPIQFVDDFIIGQVVFDQQGKFPSSVRKALENNQVRSSETNKEVVKLLAAFPMGCSEDALTAFGYTEGFSVFPAVARRELIMPMSGGYTLRSLAEDNVVSENIVQRLTTEFASRFSPGKSYAIRAVDGFLSQIILSQVFSSWKGDKVREVEVGGIKYQAVKLLGSPDNNYPDRTVAVMVAALPQSAAPIWKKAFPEVDIELRFELNYGVASTEPCRLVVSPERPDVAIFQLNMLATNFIEAGKIIPKVFFDYYNLDRWNPLLTLSLIDFLFKNRGNIIDDQQQVNSSILQLRQYTLLVLLGDHLETTSENFASRMVGLDRIKDLLRKQCQQLYPKYRTLITNPKWKDNIQQYRHALQRLISQNELSVARGRRSFVATKEEVADTFAIPGRRLTNIEPLLENLKDLIIKEEFSGRSASSEVSLRFRLHPLEEDWLSQLDNSQEKVRRNGIEVSALPAELFLRYGKQVGYTDPEITELLYLLRDRKYVDLEQRNNLLVRTVDAVDDLRDAVQAQMKTLEENVRTLAEALPDFDNSSYPLGKLRAQLEEAKERDQIEMVKVDIRQHTSRLNSFIENRMPKLKDRLLEEREKLHRLVREGLPIWLKAAFEAGPLQDLLEKQRRDLASAYQGLLEEIRVLHENSLNAARNTYNFTIEELITTYDAFQDLAKQSHKLTTRLNSYQDRQDDFEAWRHVSRASVEVNAEALNAYQVYSYPQFKDGLEQLWVAVRKRFEEQPLSFLSSYRTVGKDIEKFRQLISQWVESRRADFDEQCLTYQQMLAKAYIRAELKIPFDRERPAESRDVLISQVQNYLASYITQLEAKLRASLQIIRYAIQVQKLEIASVEQQASKTLEKTVQLKKGVSKEVIEDVQKFNTNILKPLIDLTEEEKRLKIEVQQATQKKPAQGTEISLMRSIQQSNTGQEIDLRELIIRLLDKQEEAVNLSGLMHDLESLFQKNLVDIRIRLARGEQ